MSYVLELVRQNYRDFGPTLAAEVLLERHGIEVSRETLAQMDGRGRCCGYHASSAGVFHQPRLRRESYGVSWCRSTAASIVGSRVEVSLARCWFSSMMQRASLMQLRFVPSESTASSYFEALQGYLADPRMPGGLLLGQAFGISGHQAVTRKAEVPA